ncbi:caspase family protein [Labrys okinawensis]|uniref:caspase family protein n=1 Tax=Labrys okinawensis TaxID=346911 RepID=UPI0039BCCBCB
MFRWLVPAACLILMAAALPVQASTQRDCAQSANPQLALQACTAIIEKGGRNRNEIASAYLLRGNAHLAQGELDPAIADYAKVLELRPEDANAFHATGQAYNAKGDYDRAIANYDKAIALLPNAVYSYVGRSFAYNSKRDYDAAIADCEKGIKLKPDLPDAWFACGESYMAKGNRAKALDDFQVSIGLYPPAERAGAASRIGQIEASLVAQQQASIAPVDTTQRTKDAGTPGAMASPGRRVALVIGNSAYQAVARLPNPAQDADLVGAALRQAGVQDVTIAHDLDRSAMVAALRGFADKADGADWAIIYYAGHGIEVDGTNYMIPVDARLAGDRDVPDEAVSLDRLLSAIQGARKLRLVVLDACRNNPFVVQMKLASARRAIDRGLSRIEPANATLVAYAAKEGTTALDGNGADSPFALAFAKRVVEPGLEINKIFRFVRQDVMDETDNQQEPFVYGSLPPQDFYFVSGK